MKSSHFRWGAGLFAVLGPLVICSIAWCEERKVRVQSYTFKQVGDLAIQAEVHRPDDDQIRPVVVWIHGGALINGHRSGIDNRLKNKALDAGYAIVSIDYRLAPETKLPSIIEDVKDAFAWIRKEGPSRLKIDPSRLAVAGGSAGGYLTLMTGFCVEPRPRAIVAIYGYGDIIGDWYSQPSPHPRHHQSQLSEEEARQQVSGPPVSDARDRKGNGGAFYQFCRQRGLWPKEVSGWDPHTEPEKFFPFMPVKNVTKGFSPTLLIHGTSDTDVPYEQSVMMAAELKKHGVQHELITIQGAEHGFSGGDPELIEAAYRSAIAFIQRHTGE